MSFIQERKALTREKRLSTLSHFSGSLEQLKSEAKGGQIKQKIRTFSQINSDEILFALQALSKIRQSTVIVHGSIGCAASGIHYNKEGEFHWYSTNLNERDTILGGDEKLRKAVIRAYEEQHPEVIFIVGTPVVAINNDDINAIIFELEDELDVKIISIYTDGFKTKAPTTGYDIVQHALLRSVVDANPGEKKDFLNVVSLSENKENLAAVLSILNDLEIPYHLLPQYGSIDTIKEAGAAKATIVLNSDEGAYFAEGLEELTGVPYIHTPSPIGLRGVRQFIQKLGKALDIESQANAYIEKKEAEIFNSVSQELFAGKHIFLETSLAHVPSFIDLMEQFGGSVAALAFPFIDFNNRDLVEKLDSLANATPVVIANGQPFEKANILSKEEIDFYISTQDDVSFAANYGAIPISLTHSAIFGYDGIQTFVRQITSASVTSGIQTLLQNQEPFYKASWLRKSSNWYVKQEVK